MFSQLHMLLPVKQEVSDPPAGGVRHTQLGELLLKQSQDDGVKGRAEIHTQDPGIGSCGVQVLEDVMEGQVDCIVYRPVGSVGELQGVQEGVGTGKTNLLKAVQYESSSLLSQTSGNPDDVTVLLTAPTCVAAYNIGATTIHNTFSISVNVTFPCVPLGDENINSLRAKLVNILAVSDFHQLPPVKGTPLYADGKGVNLWDNNFMVAQLTQVVRQKNVSFAEMMNRFRIRKKDEPLNVRDVHLIKECGTREKPIAVHIISTNQQVDTYNIEMLDARGPNAITIEVQDSERNLKSGRMERKTDARIMLKKNIDVSDGLVNGAFRAVVHITPSPDIGHNQRAKNQQNIPPNTTIIEPQEDQVSNNGGVRHQFPLKLAWHAQSTKYTV
ncbi:ATP-dependent DNA helicase PIF1 [Merluccius polli]|uniref:ATP-dependent DNA helicase PIF1 n=1 Tax=Merluccius polli TaxID=89951 RepID=A0AA47MHB8_MERPO|nr:ATP-dependent DNA helicase PIF1 [Merluccius polli]